MDSKLDRLKPRWHRASQRKTRASFVGSVSCSTFESRKRGRVANAHDCETDYDRVAREDKVRKFSTHRASTYAVVATTATIIVVVLATILTDGFFWQPVAHAEAAVPAGLSVAADGSMLSSSKLSASGKWMLFRESLSVARGDMSVIFYNRTFLLIGGCLNHKCDNVTNIVEQVDPIEETVTSLPPLPIVLTKPNKNSSLPPIKVPLKFAGPRAVVSVSFRPPSDHHQSSDDSEKKKKNQTIVSASSTSDLEHPSDVTPLVKLVVVGPCMYLYPEQNGVQQVEVREQYNSIWQLSDDMSTVEDQFDIPHKSDDSVSGSADKLKRATRLTDDNVSSTSPPYRCNATCVARGPYVFIIGGIDMVHQTPLNSIDVYNVASRTYYPSVFTHAEAVMNPLAAVDGAFLYVVGGQVLVKKRSVAESNDDACARYHKERMEAKNSTTDSSSSAVKSKAEAMYITTWCFSTTTTAYHLNSTNCFEGFNCTKNAPKLVSTYHLPDHNAANDDTDGEKATVGDDAGDTLWILPPLRYNRQGDSLTMFGGKLYMTVNTTYAGYLNIEKNVNQSSASTETNKKKKLSTGDKTDRKGDDDDDDDDSDDDSTSWTYTTNPELTFAHFGAISFPIPSGFFGNALMYYAFGGFNTATKGRSKPTYEPSKKIFFLYSGATEPYTMPQKITNVSVGVPLTIALQPPERGTMRLADNVDCDGNAGGTVDHNVVLLANEPTMATFLPTRGAENVYVCFSNGKLNIGSSNSNAKKATLANSRENNQSASGSGNEEGNSESGLGSSKDDAYLYTILTAFDPFTIGYNLTPPTTASPDNKKHIHLSRAAIFGLTAAGIASVALLSFIVYFLVVPALRSGRDGRGRRLSRRGYFLWVDEEETGSHDSNTIDESLLSWEQDEETRATTATTTTTLNAVRTSIASGVQERDCGDSMMQQSQRIGSVHSPVGGRQGMATATAAGGAGASPAATEVNPEKMIAYQPPTLRSPVQPIAPQQNQQLRQVVVSPRQTAPLAIANNEKNTNMNNNLNDHHTLDTCHASGGGQVLSGSGSESQLEKDNLVKNTTQDSRYNLIRRIGDGAFSSVYLVQRKYDGLLFAMKYMICSDNKQRLDAIRECETINSVQGHPNVIRLADMFMNYEFGAASGIGSQSHNVTNSTPSNPSPSLGYSVARPFPGDLSESLSGKAPQQSTEITRTPSALVPQNQRSAAEPSSSTQLACKRSSDRINEHGQVPPLNLPSVDAASAGSTALPPSRKSYAPSHFTMPPSEAPISPSPSTRRPSLACGAKTANQTASRGNSSVASERRSSRATSSSGDSVRRDMLRKRAQVQSRPRAKSNDSGNQRGYRFANMCNKEFPAPLNMFQQQRPYYRNCPVSMEGGDSPKPALSECPKATSTVQPMRRVVSGCDVDRLPVESNASTGLGAPSVALAPSTTPVILTTAALQKFIAYTHPDYYKQVKMQMESTRQGLGTAPHASNNSSSGSSFSDSDSSGSTTPAPASPTRISGFYANRQRTLSSIDKEHANAVEHQVPSIQVSTEVRNPNCPNAHYGPAKGCFTPTKMPLGNGAFPAPPQLTTAYRFNDSAALMAARLAAISTQKEDTENKKVSSPTEKTPGAAPVAPRVSTYAPARFLTTTTTQPYYVNFPRHQPASSQAAPATVAERSFAINAPGWNRGLSTEQLAGAYKPVPLLTQKASTTAADVPPPHPEPVSSTSNPQNDDGVTTANTSERKESDGRSSTTPDATVVHQPNAAPQQPQQPESTALTFSPQSSTMSPSSFVMRTPYGAFSAASLGAYPVHTRYLCLVMEYHPAGDLCHYVLRFSQRKRAARKTNLSRTPCIAGGLHDQEPQNQRTSQPPRELQSPDTQRQAQSHENSVQAEAVTLGSNEGSALVFTDENSSMITSSSMRFSHTTKSSALFERDALSINGFNGERKNTLGAAATTTTTTRTAAGGVAASCHVDAHAATMSTTENTGTDTDNVGEYERGDAKYEADDCVMRNALTEDQLLSISYQLASVLQHLHSQRPPIVHRDLKPENILICSTGVRTVSFGDSDDDEGNDARTNSPFGQTTRLSKGSPTTAQHSGSLQARSGGNATVHPPLATDPCEMAKRRITSRFIPIVVTDFGLAFVQEVNRRSGRGGGTKPYIAPESWKGQTTTTSDVWAMGCVLYALATERLTVSTVRIMSQEAKKEGFAAMILKDIVDCNYSLAFASFVVSLLVVDPKKRPTAEMLTQCFIVERVPVVRSGKESRLDGSSIGSANGGFVEWEDVVRFDSNCAFVMNVLDL